MSASTDRAIDAWVNPNVATAAAVWHEQEHPRDVAGRLFDASERIGDGTPIETTVTEMEAAGIGRGVLSSMREYSPWPDDVWRFHELTARLVDQHPDHFIAAGGVDPVRDGVMPAARMARRLVEELDFRAVKLMPSIVGRPPDDAAYYPVYATCSDLGVPVTVNVGFPGPRTPAEPQRPLHLDQVCRDFPDLRIVMTHLGWPWHLEVIGLLLKYPNLYLMTSAWAPTHYPDELVHHMGRRGVGRVMFATDYPLLPFERCAREARELPLDEPAMAAFLHETAEEVFQW